MYWLVIFFCRDSDHEGEEALVDWLVVHWLVDYIGWFIGHLFFYLLSDRLVG